MRHLLFICLLLFCVACEENESVDPTIMPEATTTGANTFGCLVDGWVYTRAGRGFQRDGFGAGRSRFVYPFYDCRPQGGRNASLCESLF